jgi:hypothetical protein
LSGWVEGLLKYHHAKYYITIEFVVRRDIRVFEPIPHSSVVLDRSESKEDTVDDQVVLFGNCNLLVIGLLIINVWARSWRRRNLH